MLIRNIYVEEVSHYLELLRKNGTKIYIDSSYLLQDTPVINTLNLYLTFFFHLIFLI